MASALVVALLLRRALVELVLEASLQQPSTFLPTSGVYWWALLLRRVVALPMVVVAALLLRRVVALPLWPAPSSTAWILGVTTRAATTASLRLPTPHG